MLTTIKDYLLTVLVRAIIGYMFFVFFLLVIFVGYIVISDWASAVNFITGLTDNDFAKNVVWMPLFFSLFKADSEGNAKGNVSKDTEDTTDFYLLTNNSIWL